MTAEDAILALAAVSALTVGIGIIGALLHEAFRGD